MIIENDPSQMQEKQEFTSEGLTRLEREVGHDGAVLADAIYLTNEGIPAPLDDIRRTLNRDGLSDEEIIAILTQANFRRGRMRQDTLSHRKNFTEDESGDVWMRPPGKEGESTWSFDNASGESKELHANVIDDLVRKHISERPSVDFGLGDKSPFAEEVDNKQFIGIGVAEPREREGDEQPGFWD